MSEDFEINIVWLVNAYGHLVPWNQILSGIEFSGLIKSAYCQDEPHNKFAFEFAKNSNCNFHANHKGVGYSLINI
jgi:hypothetical protein